MLVVVDPGFVVSLAITQLDAADDSLSLHGRDCPENS
jgi:hypothetical protein